MSDIEEQCYWCGGEVLPHGSADEVIDICTDCGRCAEGAEDVAWEVTEPA